MRSTEQARRCPPRWALLLLTPLGLVLGCPPPEDPIYDDDLGLQAVATEPGSQAGAFVLKTAIVTLADLPVDGIDQTAGGESYYLVERTWDDASATYTQVHTLCGGRLYESAGTESEITPDRWRLVEPSAPLGLALDHETGAYTTTDVIELWAIDLADPKNDPMPADGAEAQEPPHAARIFDADDDGNVGMTMHLSGLATGDVYFCQRKTLHQDGLRISNDEAAGLLDFNYEQITLGASSALLNQQLARERHPNPKEAWFWEARLAEGATCDDVMQAVADEVVPRINPFI